MLKAHHHILCLTTQQGDMLKQVQQEAAACWNAIVAEAKTHYDGGGGWISKNDLQKRIKGRFAVHSQTVQGLVDRFCGNRLTAAKNRRMGLGTNYPWREKRFLTVPFKQTAIRCSADGTVQLSLRAGVRFDTGVSFSDSIHTCEIMWRNGQYVLSCTAEYQVAEPIEPGLRAGVDIGEIHPVAVCAENGAGLVISGRQIRSVKQQRDKALGSFAKKLSRCKKGSRRWKKLRRAKARLRAKTDRQVRDLLHQATRKTIDWCQQHGVSELVIGNPAGVEKNTRKHKRLNRKARQKISQMETGRIKQYLRYKAEEAGIQTCLANERGTSRDCPVCGSQNRVRGRLFVCAVCGFSAHRDAKAGFMMLWKKHPQIPLPRFRIEHRQAFPKYRKRPLPACVDGSDVALSSLAISGPLRGEDIAA